MLYKEIKSENGNKTGQSSWIALKVFISMFIVTVDNRIQSTELANIYCHVDNAHIRPIIKYEFRKYAMLTNKSIDCIPCLAMKIMEFQWFINYLFMVWCFSSQIHSDCYIIDRFVVCWCERTRAIVKWHGRSSLTVKLSFTCMTSESEE